jgi:glycerol-3-phosphate acyltransferase PlsY
MAMTALLCALGGYLAGSIPFALLVSRAMRLPDPRSYGSGNIGATNVLRSGSRAAALATLAGDVAKGWVAVLVASSLGLAVEMVALVGFAAFVGHVFPLWLRFRGGKGVATGFGVALALAPLAAVCGAAVWVLLYKLLRISSVGSLAGAAVALLVAASTADRWPVAGLAAISCIIVLRHRPNLDRLLRHEER